MKYLEIKVNELPIIRECNDIYAMLDDYFGKNNWEESEYSEAHYANGDYDSDLAYIFIEQKNKQEIMGNRN